MSKLRIDLFAKRLEIGRAMCLERMSRAAVYHFKVEAFDRQAWDGVKWKPKKKIDGRRLLVKSGRMRSSIHILARFRDRHIVGTRVPYAKYHNDGTTHMPRRQFIGMSRKLQRTHNSIIRDFLRKAR